MRALHALALAAVLSACEGVTPEPAARCAAVSGDPTPSAQTVCANLSRLACALDGCAGAYADYRARVAPAEFNRLASCYARARSCDEVDQCERGCGPDGGAVRVGPPGSVDAGPVAPDDAATDVPDATDIPALQDIVTADAPVDVPAVDAPAPVDAPAVDAPAPVDAPAVDDVPKASDATDAAGD